MNNDDDDHGGNNDDQATEAVVGRDPRRNGGWGRSTQGPPEKLSQPTACVCVSMSLTCQGMRAYLCMWCVWCGWVDAS